MEYAAVGVGGFLGALSRYLITKAVNAAGFSPPIGTLTSNVIAGFLIGFIVGLERYSGSVDRNVKLFLTVGLLGGLSTFSTFSMETVAFIQSGRHVHAAGNIVLNLACSIAAVFLGFALARLFTKM
jgi:CrcB protein